MNRGEFEEPEMRTEVHLVIITVYTLFSVGLIAETFIMNWIVWPVFIVIGGVVTAWIMHLTNEMTPKYRIRVYAAMIYTEIFYYGTYNTSFFDLAIVVGLAIVLFALAGEATLIIVGVLVYVTTMVFQIFVNDYTVLFDSKLLLSRTLLHLACVVVSAFLSLFLIKRKKSDVKKYNEMIVSMSSANRRIEDFLTNISHELRTPINAVVGITSVMLSNERDSQKKKELKSVRRAGQMLFDQIGDILDYTEIDTGRLKLSEEGYMLSSIINDLLNEVSTYDNDKMPELVFDIAPEIPQGLSGDARKIKKILKHLVENGLKFTKEGGVCVKIYPIKKPYGINLIIEVKDTGSGIPADELSKITGGFYQTDSSRTRRAGGLGLGLAIVRGFASAMGGFMQIESTQEQGTVARVSVPQKVTDATNCMKIERPARLCAAVYIRPEKYSVPEVREYYNGMISSLVKGLGVSIYRATTFEELKKINNTYHLTHLFVSADEYTDNPSYYEALEREVIVTVVAGESFKPQDETRVLIMKKPFYPFSVVSVLDSNSQNYELKKLEEERRMIVPGASVLVVDDEKMNLIVAEGLFKDYRMHVDMAQSGPEAIEKCEKKHYDIIFMDHMMPEMDGVEAAKRIMRINFNEEERPKLVALTANAVSGAREMFLEEGFDEFVPKPVEIGELERVLKKILPATAITYVTQAGSYAIDEESEIVDDGTGLSRLKIAGINVSSGLRYSRDDEDFYYELLKNFVYEQTDKQNRMEQLYNDENWKDYRIMVHALKSSSKMIGLDNLYEEALQQEEAAKNEDVAFIRMTHDELMEHYSKNAETIKRLCGFEEEVSDSELMEIASSDFIEKLKEIKDAFVTFEVDKAEGIIAELEKYKYNNEPIGSILKPLIVFVNDFDLDSAASEADVVIDRIKGGDEA